MRHHQFGIGLEFYTATGRWRCTDVGTRVIVAIRLDREEPSWYHGPPYSVIECVFDEHDLQGCSLEPDAGGRTTPMPTTQRSFSRPILAALDAAKILGVRSGTDHKYTGVWPVVLENRLFVRSWNDKPTGWYRAFRAEPDGSIEFKDPTRRTRELRVRAKPVRSERLRKAVSAAYATKFDTKGSQKWVVGFAEPEREAHTLELVPR